MGYKSKYSGKEVEERLEKMLNVTWAELKALRDEGKLIAGQIYRMTDYETTCAWENTQVAGHPFDLVLTALDEKTLDEKCSAIWSERDTDGYFANSNLAAWDVRYCLDNDAERFDWAQMGGTTLRLTVFDEEFEAMRLGTTELGGVTYYSWLAYYDGQPAFEVLTKSENPSIGDEAYATMDGETIDSTAEVIGLYEKKGGTGVIYLLVDDWENSVRYDFKNIMFKRLLTEGKYDAENGVDTFCYTFSHIDIETHALSDLSIDGTASSNTMGLWSYNNVFFGDFCYNNTFGDTCNDNTFGDNCYDNTFGDNCYNNTFGDNCYNNTFGGNCNDNTFGDTCHDNTFGDNCNDNTFGDLCYNNTFGDNCHDNTLVSPDTENSYSYYNFIIFEGDNQYITIQNTNTDRLQRFLQHINVANGLAGTSSQPLVVEIEHVSATYKPKTTIAINSSGSVKVYCEADLVN